MARLNSRLQITEERIIRFNLKNKDIPYRVQNRNNYDRKVKRHRNLYLLYYLRVFNHALKKETNGTIGKTHKMPNIDTEYASVRHQQNLQDILSIGGKSVTSKIYCIEQKNTDVCRTLI